MIQNSIIIHKHAILFRHSQKSNQIIKRAIFCRHSPLLIEFTEIPQVYDSASISGVGRGEGRGTVNPVACVVVITAFASGGNPNCSDAHVFEEGEVSSETFPMVPRVIDVPFESLEKSAIRWSWLLR